LVLLKNIKNTLPFAKGKKVAVVGPHYNATRDLLGTYVGTTCPKGKECVVGLFSAIEAKNQGGTTTGAPGCNNVDCATTTGFNDAVNAAKGADLVVLAIGIAGSVEHETQDRKDMLLPGNQLQLAQSIINLGKPTAVVVIHGGIVGIEWIDNNAPAILDVNYPGIYGAEAIADALFGDYNPGGKLAVTWYYSNWTDQMPMKDMSMTTGTGRSYRYYKGTPLYPFGYGLSYTTFKLEWSNTTQLTSILDLRKDPLTDPSQVVHYSVKVTNTGNVAGDEVVLAFFYPNQKDDPLIKQLFGFQRVHLEPGASVTLLFDLTRNTLQIGDNEGRRVSYPGDYVIAFTNGVKEVLQTKLLVKGSKVLHEKWL